MSRAWTSAPSRILTNLVLAYVCAAAVTGIGIAAGQALSPAKVGPGVLSSWIFEVSLLVVGSPIVLLVLAVLDVALRRRSDQRRAALIFAISPSVLLALLMPIYPMLLGIVVWLLATGLTFGVTTRLPPSPGGLPEVANR
jgi:hypothetical protein